MSKSGNYKKYKTLPRNFRRGAIGALLDEYERAISELASIIETIPDQTLTMIKDAETTDEDCRSFQTILSHLVHSGYGYATSIRNLKGPVLVRPEKTFHLTIKEYQDDLTKLFTFTEIIFSQIREDELEQFDNSLKIKTGWGQIYDIEQLTEHAIVHVLRHRRQIEKFI